jgi:hypothetical protein
MLRVSHQIAWKNLQWAIHDQIKYFASAFTRYSWKIPVPIESYATTLNKETITDCLQSMEKVYITPTIEGGLHNPQHLKRFIPPLNFQKPVKLPPKSVLKNHIRSQKNHKIENLIVLNSKWVDILPLSMKKKCKFDFSHGNQEMGKKMFLPLHLHCCANFF